MNTEMRGIRFPTFVVQFIETVVPKHLNIRILLERGRSGSQIFTENKKIPTSCEDWDPL
jgi:hypothetical protein